MINFAAPSLARPAAPVPQAPPATARPVGATGPVSMAATDLLDSPMDWSWEQLRDYVMRSVAERHGPQPRHESMKVNSVFKSFAARWGSQAGPIARFAFEDQDGFWRSSPVTMTRFMKGNDPHFAAPISERLADV